MKSLIFSIIKLLMSLVFQYSIFMGSWYFVVYAGYSFYSDYELLYWVVFITAFLLSEGGIYLLYTVKPLEKRIYRNIYTIVYMGIHVIAVIIFAIMFFLPLFLKLLNIMFSIYISLVNVIF